MCLFSFAMPALLALAVGGLACQENPTSRPFDSSLASDSNSLAFDSSLASDSLASDSSPASDHSSVDTTADIVDGAGKDLAAQGDGSTSGNTSAIPISWNDPAFAKVVNSASLSLGNGATKSNLSITDNSGDAAIVCNGSCNLDHIRISAREGIRCTTGTLNIESMWIEVKGQPSDHADGLQCYSPGSKGTNTVKNTTFRSYTNDATAGYWSADNWKGSHHFENVLFWGGPYGLRIPYDGGSEVYLKNVYFVQGSFGAGPFLFDANSSGHIPILQWDNVRWATVVNGQLVLGAQIPKPK